VLFVSSTDYFLHVGYISHLSLYVDQLFGISLVQIAGIPLSNDHDDPCRADALISLVCRCDMKIRTIYILLTGKLNCL
jgi:hypothetical protein